jgi:hypothetical protein
MAQEDWRRRLDEAMKRFQTRRIYTSFDIVALRAIPDDEIEQALFDYASRIVWDTKERRLENFHSMPIGIQALCSTWMVDAEVNNGGFNQYFWNSSGAFAEEAVDGFVFFGATELAALMREAIALAHSEANQRGRFKRENTLEAFSESYKHTKLGELDQRYYKLAENFGKLRINVIRERPEQFVTGATTIQ